MSAYAIPEPEADNEYNYEWTLISGPSDSGLIENRQMRTVSLKQLQEGTYLFKVVVSGGNPEVRGVGHGNVTVFPPERINKAPKAVVNPGTYRNSSYLIFATLKIIVKLAILNKIRHNSVSRYWLKFVKFHFRDFHKSRKIHDVE